LRLLIYYLHKVRVSLGDEWDRSQRREGSPWCAEVEKPVINCRESG
jgi:hypothetical protein